MARQELIYDYSKLKGKIKEVCNTQDEFAWQMGLSARSITLKLSSARSWKQDEIIKAIGILGLTEDDIQDYFFALKVHKC